MNEARFIELALANEINRAIAERLPAVGLSDAWLVSGALFQAAWNGLTNRPPEYGIKDYDIFYFDADVSWEAEDFVIRRVSELFGDLDGDIQIRNQARVHLWYAEKFGRSYTPLTSSCRGIDRFPASVSKVGMRFDAAGYIVYAPEGLSDIEPMIVRPSYGPYFHADAYEQKAARWKLCWPELTVLHV